MSAAARRRFPPLVDRRNSDQLQPSGGFAFVSVGLAAAGFGRRHCVTADRKSCGGGDRRRWRWRAGLSRWPSCQGNPSIVSGKLTQQPAVVAVRSSGTAVFAVLEYELTP
jgi:hypothetical protein